MRIVQVRRISQVFFLLLFLVLAIVTTWGDRLWQLRGWPVNAFLQFDPLIAIGSALASGVLHAGLLWALVTVALTAILGRAFCGWVCPFGTIHQAVGWLGKAFRPGERARANRPHPAQAFKYYILAFLLSAGSADAAVRLARGVADGRYAAWVLVTLGLAALVFLALEKVLRSKGKAAALTVFVILTWVALGRILHGEEVVASSVQIGLLDPLVLLHRSVSLVVLPVLDRSIGFLFLGPRYTQGVWLIGGILVAAVLLNLVVPRFYCRFICPLGALLGLLGRSALWRIGQKPASACTHCNLCEADCEGACEPAKVLRQPECVLCMNCLGGCKDGLIGFRTTVSEAGEHPLPDVSRRGVLLSLASGFTAVPLIRLTGKVGPDYPPGLVRPPGSLAEEPFLDLCVKCGQCMRICPTGVLQPAGVEGGLETLWTPILNNRIGTSGCQVHCVACGQICPTGAIRPFTLDEKRGIGAFSKKGPIRMGTAFIDRGRCLPWAMDRPCIVCQETCPVSPKAIYLKDTIETIRDGVREVITFARSAVRVAGPALSPGRLGSGAYLAYLEGSPDLPPRRILGNTTDTIALDPSVPWPDDPAPGDRIRLAVRLRLPFVDPQHCTGCGICEHECPVTGLRAIRVTAENESRSRVRGLIKG